MSQRLIDPLPAYRDYKVAVGWDRPLGTFFVQVLPPQELEDDEDSAFVWEGTDRGEITDPRLAVDMIAPYAQIPDDLVDLLDGDRYREGTRW